MMDKKNYRKSTRKSKNFIDFDNLSVSTINYSVFQKF